MENQNQAITKQELKVKVVIATGNQNKVKEFARILENQGFNPADVVSAKSIGYDGDPVENGKDLETNAMIKVLDVVDYIQKRKLFYHENYIVLSDDTGLFVNKLPTLLGVRTARLASDLGYEVTKETRDDLNNKILLEKMKDVDVFDRDASYETAIGCYAYINKESFISTGYGDTALQIGTEVVEGNGFAYDKICKIDTVYEESIEDAKYISQLTDEEKDSISSRKRAIEDVVENLMEIYDIN